MKDKVTRQCPQTTTFEEKGQPKRNRAKALLLTSLTPYRQAKPAHRGRPGLPVPNKPYGVCGREATLNRESIRVQELCGSRRGRPGLPVPDKPYGFCGRKATLNRQSIRAQELCESRGGRPGLPVPNKPYGFCGREATLKKNTRPDLSCLPISKRLQRGQHVRARKLHGYRSCVKLFSLSVTNETNILATVGLRSGQHLNNKSLILHFYFHLFYTSVKTCLELWFI